MKQNEDEDFATLLLKWYDRQMKKAAKEARTSQKGDKNEREK
jgi:hypothetical protein